MAGCRARAGVPGQGRHDPAPGRGGGRARRPPPGAGRSGAAYNSPSRVEFWRRLRKRGHPRDAVFFMEIVYTLARRGWNAQEGSDLRRLLQREPTSFRQFAEDYKWRWETQTWT